MQYVAPNAKEIIDVINSYEQTSIDNTGFKWGEQCSLNRIPLKSDDWVSLLKPSLDLLANDFNVTFDFILSSPWINLYRKGDHQEVHDHLTSEVGVRVEDFVCVFAANEGEGFSKLYFRDRCDMVLTPGAQSLISDYYSVWMPDLKAGNIIFFPSHMLHGVSPQKSDIIRKTVACNFSITSVTKKESVH